MARASQSSSRSAAFYPSEESEHRCWVTQPRARSGRPRARQCDQGGLPGLEQGLGAPSRRGAPRRWRPAGGWGSHPGRRRPRAGAGRRVGSPRDVRRDGVRAWLRRSGCGRRVVRDPRHVGAGWNEASGGQRSSPCRPCRCSRAAARATGRGCGGRDAIPDACRPRSTPVGPRSCPARPPNRGPGPPFAEGSSAGRSGSATRRGGRRGVRASRRA